MQIVVRSLEMTRNSASRSYLPEPLRAKPAPCGLPPVDMIADYFDRRRNGYCQNESDRAPQPSPEQQCNCHGQGAQMNPAPNDSRHQDIDPDHVEKTQHRGDTDVRTDRFPMGHTD